MATNQNVPFSLFPSTFLPVCRLLFPLLQGLSFFASHVLSLSLSHLAGAHHAVHLEIRCEYKQSFPNFQILQKEKAPALPWAGVGVLLV